MRNIVFVLGLVWLLITGCNLNDNFDQVPMFVQVNSVDLITTDNQGANSHAIRDVWVFVDGFTVGIFEVTPDKPARIPVLSEDDIVRVEFFAGIRNNGLTLNPKDYPFYERITLEMDFRPNEVVEMDLVFEYKDDIVFSVLEDFENSQVYENDIDGDEDKFITITSDPDEVAYGLSCAKYVSDTIPDLFGQTTDFFETSMFGASEVYLEIDFKSEIPFILGYVGFDENGNFTTDFTIVLNSTDVWTKLYLDLSAALNGGDFEAFQLLVAGAPLDVLNSNIEKTGTILFDNVKLVHQAN
jgi:hypothetical protein